MAEVGPDGEHEATATLLVLFVAQVVSVQLLEDAIGEGLHDATPVGPELMIGQVVSVQLLEEDAVSATQVPVGTLSVELTLQVRVV